MVASATNQNTIGWCVPLEHGYGAWENKEKVQNNDQKNSDRGDKDCLHGYHEDNNTTDKLRP
jgi:hypothetical protein